VDRTVQLRRSVVVTSTSILGDTYLLLQLASVTEQEQRPYLW